MSDDDRLEEMSFEKLEQERGLALHSVMSFVAVLIILGLTAMAIWILEASKPTAEKRDEVVAPIRRVEVVLAKQVEGGVKIFAEGVVESQQVVRLSAEVTGKLIEVNANLVPGGQVRKGEVLVVIDPADYRAALEQAKAAKERSRMGVADAELAMEEEDARRDQALRDWKKLGEGEPSDLLARRPQLASAQARLASAKADVASAQAEIERASRNLSRTIIRAPFDAVVREESVEVGAVLAPGALLATLFSERSLEVALPVALEDYALLQRDEHGAVQGAVTLRGKLGIREVVWPGRIVRTTGEVDRGALSAGVVVAVEAIDGKGELRLPPSGLFVRAELEGQSFAQAVAIPREAVREGERAVVVSDEGLLDWRALTVIRSNASEIFVSKGVEVGERVVLTRLTGAIQGMEVEVESSTDKEEGG